MIQRTLGPLWKHFWVGVAILGIVSLDGCDSCHPSPAALEKGVTYLQEANCFADTINRINVEVPDLDMDDALFGSQLFIEVYEHPAIHFSSAISLILRRDVSTHQKKIVGFAMQRLPLEEFVTFLSTIIITVEQGVTDIKVLEATAFAPLNWGRQTLIMHYQHPQVQVLLNRLMRMPKLPVERKVYIKDRILSGQAKLDYLDYMDMMDRPVKE